MKNRLLATVLTLALLCPMMSYILAPAVNAALEVDDGASLVSSSNILNEEWNFDDMAEGEVLTNGYISSHARGNFGAMSSTDGFAQLENWSAVIDTETGNVYITSDNSYLAIADKDKLLLKNTYEISWKLKVDSIGSHTTLLWWSETESSTDKNCLFRFNNDAAIGYTTNNTYQSTVGSGRKATLGEWHDYKARINPADGRIWLWLDGDLVVNGEVNTYLRDNSKDAEYSNIGIFFAWDGSNIKASVDDVKITPVQIDEYIDFGTNEQIAVIDELLDFEELTVDNTVSADAFNSVLKDDVLSFSVDGDGNIVSAADPKKSTNKVIKNTNKKMYFTFDRKFSSYVEVELSFDVMFENMGGWTTLLSYNSVGVSGDFNKLIRLKSEDSTLRDNGEGLLATLTQGDSAVWYSMSVKITPATGAVALVVTERDSGTAVVTKNWTISNIATLSTEEDMFVLKLHQSWNSDFISYFDNIAIKATPAPDKAKPSPINASWNLDDGTLADKSGVTVKAGSGYDFGTVENDTVNTSKALRILKGSTSGNVTGPTFTLPGSVYDYDSVTVSFKTRYNYTSNWSNVFRFIKADGGTKNLLRVSKMNKPTETNTSPTVNMNLLADTGTRAGKLTNGVWSQVNVTVRPYANEISIKVDDGTVVNLNGNADMATIFSDLNKQGKPFAFVLYYQVGMYGEVFFDDISIKATVAPINAEAVVDGLWNDPSFDMTVSPDVGGMANDDWTIDTDPKLVNPKGFWDFEDGTVAAQNGINASIGSQMEIKRVETDTVNTTQVLATINTSGTRYGPVYKLPGSFRDYDRVNISYKIKYNSASNWTNGIRFVNANGNDYYTLFRYPTMSTGGTYTVAYRTVGTTQANSTAKITVGEWCEIDLVITPSTGAINATINGTSFNFTNISLKDVYNADRALEFMLYYHVGMTAEVYIDDVSISTVYSKEYKESMGYSLNSVLKTVTDASGNTRGIFAIKDNEKYLANQPFELSFDYMMNQLPSGWLNLVKLKMTNDAFSIFRLAPDGTVYNYTSARYVSPTADSGLNLGPNVSAKKLATGNWYNVRVVFDPNSGHIMGYIDNVLVCDYNINDVYIDTSGEPLGVTVDPIQMYIELGSQYASSIKINDSCFDNLRIRTLNYDEVTKIFLTNTDFNKVTAGALDAVGFAKATGLYAKSLNGSFSVVGTDTSKYVEATVKTGDGIEIDVTNGYSPLHTDVVAFEGNFTFTALPENGSLDLFSFKYWGGDGWNQPYKLLSVNTENKLCIGGEATSFVVGKNTVYGIKLVYSGISGTAELYVNDKFIAVAPVIAQSQLEKLSYFDEAGNEIPVGYKKFLVSESTETKTLSGVMLQSAVMPYPNVAGFTETALDILTVEGDGTWGVVFDDLSIYRDDRAYIYADNTSAAPEFIDISSRLWGNDYVAQFNYNGAGTEIASILDWTLGDTATSLVKAGGGKLYAADGTTELATLGENADVAVIVNSDYWEAPVAADNYVVKVTVYVDGAVAGNYVVVKTTATSSGSLKFAEGASDAKVYFGNALRDNRTPTDASGVKFEGYNAFSIDFEDEMLINTAEANAINYVEWAYADRDKTITDWEGATVKLSELVTEDGNSFFRIRRPEISNKPTAYMEYNLGAMGGYIDLYSVEMDVRYTDNIASSLHVATLFEKNMAGKLTLLSIDYEGNFYFENNGIRYYLCDNAGANLKANAASDESFTKVGIVVNDAEGWYSVWIDGQTAWYYAEGHESGAVVKANAIPLNYVKYESYTICDAKIRLFEGSNNTVSDSVADVDNISIDVIKAGLAPVNYGFQASETGEDIRFVATVDTLYANSVGFEITAVSAIDGTKTYTDSTNLVFSSIEADGETVSADTLGGRYVSVLSITGLKVSEYSFAVKPFIEYFGEKVYGEELVYEYEFKTITSAE